MVAAMLVAAKPAWGAADCPVVDLETPLEQLARDTASLSDGGRIAAYRHTIVGPHAELYRPEVLGGFPDGLDGALLVSLEGASRGAARAATLREVREALTVAKLRFQSAFPDFRCDFPIYLMDSLGRLDGAGRQVGGRPALVLGIDEIERERGVLPLPLFLAHELFHRYHSQAAGFSDDPGEHQAIWRALWAEGLATYVSYRLTPGASVDDALIAPRDLAVRAQPQIRTISADLLAHLGETNHDVYRTYFTYGDPSVSSRGLPWRSGYYAGFLIAQDLGRTRSLRALAHLRDAPLEAEIKEALLRLAK